MRTDAVLSVFLECVFSDMLHHALSIEFLITRIGVDIAVEEPPCESIMTFGGMSKIHKFIHRLE